MRRILHIALVALAALCCACSQQPRDFFDTIPADAAVIVKADIDQLLKMADCQSAKGAIAFTPQLRRAAWRADSAAAALIEAAALQGRVLDMHRAFIFSTSGPSPSLVLTAPLRSEHAQQRETLRIIDSRTTDAVALGATLITDGEQGWIALESPQRLEAIVDSVLTMPLACSISSSPHLMRFFARPSQLLVAAHVPEFDNPLGDDFTHVMADALFSDRSVSVSLRFMSDGADVDPFALLRPTDAYAYERMPIGASLAFVVGLSPEAVKQLSPQLALLPPTVQLLAQGIVHILDARDGTLAAAFAPGGNAETIRDVSMESWLARVMLPMTEMRDAASEIIATFSQGILYSEPDSTYLAITNYDMDFYPSAPALLPRSDADDAVAAASLLIPYRSEVMKAFGLRHGYNINAVCADSTASVTVHLLGPASYILPSIINDLK